MAFNCGDVGDVANVPVSIPVSDSDLREDHIPPGRKREREREREIFKIVCNLSLLFKKVRI